MTYRIVLKSVTTWSDSGPGPEMSVMKVKAGGLSEDEAVAFLKDLVEEDDSAEMSDYNTSSATFTLDLEEEAERYLLIDEATESEASPQVCRKIAGRLGLTDDLG